MADDYLWDRTGTADPDVQALERLLAPLAVDDSRGAPHPVPTGSMAPHPMSSRWTPAVAAAALLVLAVGMASLGPASLDGTLRESDPGWLLAPMRGRPQVASTAVDGPSRVPAGTWIATDESTSVRLEIGAAGRVIIAPGSRVRVTRTAPGGERLYLEHGTLDALIWAPPGQVVVSTPVVTAVDLGCAYTLTLDPSGRGSLRVTTGWVGLVHEGREAFIPAGARVDIHATGPGTPVLVAATEILRNAVARFDTTLDASTRDAALATILRESSPGDALTLWHLLPRATSNERAAIFDALAARLAPPTHVTRDGIVAGDRAMLDAWWTTLGYGPRDWWRLWLRDWRDVGAVSEPG